jgi:RNA polymerase sigma-70 factor, ECF subfamily
VTIVTKGTRDMTDWPQIVEQHGPMVWSTVYRLLHHDADAADCFQRAFLAALQFSQTAAVRSWPALLRRLATARGLDMLRERRRSITQGASINDMAIAPEAAQPGPAAEASELAAQLRLALTELDDRQAQVFCLASLENCSYEEIAEQLGITVNHVGVLLHRARASLQERLKSFDPAAVPRNREGTP